MKAIANLPQGAIVLPGFDFDMPSSVWSALLSSPPTEDHPQYRFAALLQDLGINNGDVGLWTDERPFEPERNKLVSLALRPAPVTDQWLKVGPELEAIDSATKDLTVLEAPSQRLEALAIAMRLRKAAEENQTIAVITPDRGLTRQIGAALDRWSILPDDSAGIPLHLSSPGRFLRHVSELLHKPLSAELLLTILKHPLTHSGSDRGPHLRLSRELELHLRRNGPPYPTPEALLTWAAGERDPLAKSWVDWIVKNFCLARETEQCDLTYLSRRHIDLAEAIARGSTADTDGELWKGDAGTEALDVVSELAESAQFGGDMRSVDYISLFYSMLSYRQVRSARDPHPNVMIWGTLEARVQGADVLILAGLNENSWPEAPSPDPWLNRDMRRQLGLLLPERRIGLSAHDFQQAIANKEVWLTRSVRSSDAETVPSRWLNRLKNLLGGLPGEIGPKSLAEMIERGDHWIEMAKSLETPIPSESALRPAPSPVPSARPKQLSVTQIKTLIRDPYAIYARHILGLRPLDSLMRVPDALLRGTVVHKALEDFIRETKHNIDDVTVARFVSHLSHWLEEHVPWAEARVMWEAKIAQVAERFVAGEQARRLVAQPSLLETKGRATLDDIGFSLTGEADRIDIDAAGHFHVYDYKTGVLPNKTVQKYFDKQLLLEAAIAEINGFGEMPPAPVARALFIGLGSGKSEEPAPLDEETPGQVWEEFRDLIRVYIASRQGFASRRAPQKMADEGDYDHLARFGEWDMTDTPRLIEVG
jgi:RecB family exonuclease